MRVLKRDSNMSLASINAFDTFISMTIHAAKRSLPIARTCLKTQSNPYLISQVSMLYVRYHSIAEPAICRRSSLDSRACDMQDLSVQTKPCDDGASSAHEA
eukprot:1069447-Pleurochrysis_carterae.AAC.1